MSDPQIVRRALAATRAELAAEPPLRMPGDLAGRLAEELDRVDREADGVARAPRAPAARRRRPVVLTAAAVAVALALPVAQGPADPGDAAPDLAGAVAATLAAPPSGPFTDRSRLGACLSAVGAAPPGPVVGTRETTMNGRSGVLVVMTTGVLGRFRVVLAEPGCGLDTPAAGGALLVDSVLGG
ncbi:MAG TPA: hypothetical protein VGO23_00105 [Pseudonocardia sp.]|nr:hypothetical protein [Pseudonocardia sp.]